MMPIITLQELYGLMDRFWKRYESMEYKYHTRSRWSRCFCMGPTVESNNLAGMGIRHWVIYTTSNFYVMPEPDLLLPWQLEMSLHFIGLSIGIPTEEKKGFHLPIKWRYSLYWPKPIIVKT